MTDLGKQAARAFFTDPAKSASQVGIEGSLLVHSHACSEG
jgi:hypothetical protein